MSMDLEIIAELERELGRKLSHLKGDVGDIEKDVMGFALKRGYILDGKDNVVALSLFKCFSERIPVSVLKLKNLRTLSLALNTLRQFPVDVLCIKGLQTLQLADNEITEIPASVLSSGLALHVNWSGAGIAIRLNPLESPPAEIISKGMDAVRAYFASLAGETVRLNEVKVLFVGDGGAGKTSLVKRIVKNDFDANESQTHGINIDAWEVTRYKETVKARLWDFGGQEIMHATHQFFLSERSVYVLVLDGRRKEDAEYWLKHIESFGGNSPILVVLNKMDENPEFDVNRRFLQEKHPGIIGFYNLSCRTKKGVPAFKKALREALHEVDIIQTTWGASWFRVKSRLEEMKDPFIGLDAYQRLCEEEGVADGTAQDTLVQFLHDLGVVVHFPDFQLVDLHVLEPRWLTGAVYRIINSPILADGKGVLRLKSLRQILKKTADAPGYPADKHPCIVGIMKKFELCYSIDDSTVLVPSLLEVQEPAIDFDYDGSLCFRIDYDFFPRSIMPRFIVRRHAHIDDELRWRTGVVLKDDAFDARAVIKADESAKRIYIYVDGPQRREYLTVLRSVFLDINRGFEKLPFTERVPLPDNLEVTVSYDHLRGLEQDGEELYKPDGADKRYNVKDLLGTLFVEPKAKRRTEAEFEQMLRSIVNESDSKDTITKKANEIIQLQPNFFGFGINVNALVGRFLKGRAKGG